MILRFFAIVLSLALVGCSGQEQISNVENDKVVETTDSGLAFLGSWSPVDQEASEKAFSELTRDQDEFTKEFYLKDVSYEPDYQLTGDFLYFDFFLYKMGKENSYKPTVLLQYLSKEWLFMSSVFFKIGEDVIEVKPSQPRYEKVLDGGFVNEIATFEFADDQVEFLSRVLSEELEIRVNGTQSKIDTKLTTSESSSLVRSLQAYRYTRQTGI